MKFWLLDLVAKTKIINFDDESTIVINFSYTKKKKKAF